MSAAAHSSSHSQYLSRIRAYPVLTREAEAELARQWRDNNDRKAAQRLVESNLRFVVKIAGEYRTYGLKMEDLIQEGNLGLMKAVEKFDPDKGYRLISYAVWWIRAYIHNLILRSWSLVKMGTTQAQRRLFYQLGRAKRRLNQLEGKTREERTRVLAEKLDATEEEVTEMERRLAGRDASLDTPIGDDSDTTYLEQLACKAPTQDEQLVEHEQRVVLREKLLLLSRTLNKRERYILERRLLSETPETLREIGAHFGVSRERIRQLETAILDRLRIEVSDELGFELGATPASASAAAD